MLARRLSRSGIKPRLGVAAGGWRPAAADIEGPPATGRAEASLRPWAGDGRRGRCRANGVRIHPAMRAEEVVERTVEVGQQRIVAVGRKALCERRARAVDAGVA